MAGKPGLCRLCPPFPLPCPRGQDRRPAAKWSWSCGISVAQSLRPPDSHFDFWPLSATAAAAAPVSRSFTHLQFPSRSFPPLPSPPSILPSLPTSLLPIQIIADLFRCCLPPSLGLCKICRIEIRGTFSSAANANTEVLPLML